MTEVGFAVQHHTHEESHALHWSSTCHQSLLAERCVERRKHTDVKERKEESIP